MKGNVIEYSMTAVWGVAVILEKLFVSTHIVHQQNIGENGRIVINKGINEIFFLHFLHYNDTCKVSQQFVGGECKGVENQLQWGKKIQDSLWQQYRQNVNCLRLVLETTNPTDYMGIVSYYAGDCGKQFLLEGDIIF